MRYIRDIIQLIEAIEDSEIYYHGTSSGNLESIKKLGFQSGTYFTKSTVDAEYYAATGGEWSLQQREESFEEEYGINPREEWDAWEMYEKLYPKGEKPVILKVVIPNDILEKYSEEDSGAEEAIVLNCELKSDSILSISDVKW